MKLFLVVAVIVFVVIAVLVAVDVASSPTPAGSMCELDIDIVLPDSCAGSCDPIAGCIPLTTRPYLIVFEQAATCPDLCVRLDGGG